MSMLDWSIKVIFLHKLRKTFVWININVKIITTSCGKSHLEFIIERYWQLISNYRLDRKLKIGTNKTKYPKIFIQRIPLRDRIHRPPSYFNCVLSLVP